MLAGGDCNDYARKELRSAPCYVAVPQRYGVERARVNGDNIPSHELPLNVVWRTYSDSHDRQIDSIGTCIYSISGPSLFSEAFQSREKSCRRGHQQDVNLDFPASLQLVNQLVSGVESLPTNTRGGEDRRTSVSSRPL
jgi:hypothetical protein